MEGVWEHMTGSSFYKNCPPWKPARLPADIHPRRRFFANFNRHCRARWQSFSLASHTPMRFFISPSQCIPVRQPRGDTATHEGRRREAHVAMKWAGGRGNGRKGSRDIFNYQPEVPILPLSLQLLAISCQIFPACHWTALALTIHLPSPATLSRSSSSYLPNYFQLSWFHDCDMIAASAFRISPTELAFRTLIF